MTDARDPLADALREWSSETCDAKDAAWFRAILARHGLAVVAVEKLRTLVGIAAASVSCVEGADHDARVDADLARLLAAAQEGQR